MTDSSEIASTAKSADIPTDKLSTEAVHSAYLSTPEPAQSSDLKSDKTSETGISPKGINDQMTLTLMVKCKASEAEIDRTLDQINKHERRPLTDAEFNSRFGADPGSIARVEKFARDHGLTTDRVNVEAGQVVLKGRIGDFDKALNLNLTGFQPANKDLISAPSGRVPLPRSIAMDVQGVVGLDNRVIAPPAVTMHDAPPVLPGSANKGYLPTEVADAYHFPKDSMGFGQSVGLIELGGGLNIDDNAQYYRDHLKVVPKIQLVGVDGIGSRPGFHQDSEVVLDSQIIGMVAPDAHQQIVFAPDNLQGFIDGVTRATFPEKGEMQNSAISISWGVRESFWTKDEIHSMDEVLKKAALKGITVLAATGDSGASDASADGEYNVDFPASDPFVTSCGGTELHIDPKGGANTEVAWNEGSDYSGATGGGISNIFAVPDFQQGVALPPNLNRFQQATGRGTPDVAGDAAQETGYRVRLWGVESVGGGTSAVPALYAGLVMRINGALGHPVGDLNPFLYKNADKGIFHTITEGDNNGYKNTTGWSATTGWGSIIGDKLLQQYRLQDRSGASKPG